jgi:teichuronic acid biosynthesis glycosyltransferase TuaC
MKVLIVTAIYPTADNPAFGSYVRTQSESLQRAGIDVEMLVLRHRNRKLIYPLAIFQLRKRLARSTVDIAHAHYGLVGLIARTQWRVPVVVTYHGSDILGAVNKHGKRPLVQRAIASACRVLARHVDAAIVQSDEMAGKIGKANVHVIPHEVDLEVFKPTDREQARAILGLDSHKRYLLFAANPKVGVKRFPLAKAAADQLARHDSRVEMLVVTHESQTRLALYMSACDALVFPSFQEGSPNIVKQAMACNLPMVCTDVGDVRQVVESTKYCYICNPRAEEFATKLAEILAHRNRSNGRDNIRHLDSPAVARRVIAVYEEVLRRREGGAIAKRQNSSSLLPVWYSDAANQMREPPTADK